MNTTTLPCEVLQPGLASIQSEKGFSDFDLAELAALVYAGCERFLVGDLQQSTILGVESPFTKQLGPYTHLGTTDVFLSSPDGLSIVDWKTSGDLDLNWVRRHQNSFQWKMYLWLTGATTFTYRGIERFPESWLKSSNGDLSSMSAYKVKLRELTLHRSTESDAAAVQYLHQLNAARQAYLPFPVWPQNDGNCIKGRDLCSRYLQCWGNKPKPEGPPTFDVYKRSSRYPQSHFSNSGTVLSSTTPFVPPMSYSDAKNFLGCPEKYRLGILDPVDESTPATRFGNAFHRAMAAVYQQFIGQ